MRFANSVPFLALGYVVLHYAPLTLAAPALSLLGENIQDTWSIESHHSLAKRDPLKEIRNWPIFNNWEPRPRPQQAPDEFYSNAPFGKTQ